MTEQSIPPTNNHQAPGAVKKSGYFRWQGLLGFVSVLILIGSFLWVFAGQLIKLAIEEGGSWYWGAEVNVATVDIEWSPFKLAINQFQATDPYMPSHNTVAFNNATVSVDLWQFIFGRSVIHQLIIDDVVLQQPRQSPGQVFVVPGKPTPSMTDQAASLFGESMASLPDINTLLADNGLKTVQASLHLQKVYQEEKALLYELKNQLPTKEQLKEYEQAVKAISKTKINSPEQLLALKAELDKLKVQFKQDQAVLVKAKDQLLSSQKRVTEALTQLKDAPANDYKVIAEKYSLNSNGASNITETLLGSQAKAYYQLANQIYLQVKPMLDKMNKAEAAPKPMIEQGHYVHFADQNPQPSWLVEHARVSVSTPQGQFKMEINELTAEHWHRNQPTTLTVSSDNLLTSGGLALDATVFVALDPSSSQGQKPEKSITASANWLVTNIKLAEMPIHQSEAFNLSLVAAVLELQGKFSYAKHTINSENKLSLSQSRFAGESANKTGQVMVDLLSDIGQFSVDLNASGDVTSPNFSIHSELDTMLYDGIKKRFGAELNKFKDKAKAGLEKKLAAQLNLNQGDSSELANMGLDFDNIEKSLESLLKQQINNKLEDTLKDKLKSKLGDLFNE